MSPRVLVALLTLAGCCAFAPLPFPKPAKQRSLGLTQAMQGLWEVKSRVRSTGASSTLSTQKFVKIDGTTWTFLRANRTAPSGPLAMTLNLTEKPVTLDLSYPAAVRAKGKLQGPYMVGRLELVGDTMRFCYRLRTDRPASMAPTKPGDYLFTLQRVQKP